LDNIYAISIIFLSLGILDNSGIDLSVKYIFIRPPNISPTNYDDSGYYDFWKYWGRPLLPSLSSFLQCYQQFSPAIRDKEN